MNTNNHIYKTLDVHLIQFPATIIDVLGLKSPNFLPQPMYELSSQYKKLGVEKIVIILIDNFGLFEVTVHKPEFIIQNSREFLLLNTKIPFTHGVLNQILYGGLQPMDNGFHLLRFLNMNEKSTVYIGRKKDLDLYGGKTTIIPKETDMETWVEATKVLNRHDVSLIHFLDFETIHKGSHANDEKSELLERLIKRTDNWINTWISMLAPRSLMIIIGTHGRHDIDVKYDEKISELRGGSVPAAFCIFKE